MSGKTSMHKIIRKILTCLLLVSLIIPGTPTKAYAADNMVVSAYNQVRDRYTNMIYYNVKIQAKENLDISKLVIGYHIVEDAPIPIPNFFCDYCGVVGNNQNNNITQKVNGSVYLYNTPMNPKFVYRLEITFDNDAGIIYKNSTLEVKVRMAKPDWSIFDQSDDYSFMPNATYYTSNWNRFIVYYDGVPLY